MLLSATQVAAYHFIIENKGILWFIGNSYFLVGA